MKFKDIGESTKVFPGEYLLYSPQHRIVMCGAFNRTEDYIRAFGDGRTIEDKIEKFQKIYLDQQEASDYRSARKRCKGCGR